MRRTTASLALTLLLFAMSDRCQAMMGIVQVSREGAKKLGMELRFRDNGPSQVCVELEFKPEGKLKDFQHVSLEIRDGKNFLLGYAPLEEKRPKTGSVVVGFLADRAYLDKVTLSVVTGSPMNMTGHELRLKEFIGPAKPRRSAQLRSSGRADEGEGAALVLLSILIGPRPGSRRFVTRGYRLMGGGEGMGDLRSRAAAHFSGPRPIRRLRGGTGADGLILRYVDGEPWDDPELRMQLSRCLEEALAASAGLEGATGPARDAKAFYRRAAELLEAIQTEVYGEPG